MIRKANLDDALTITAIHVESSKAAYEKVIPKNILNLRTKDIKLPYWENSLKENKTVTLVYEVNREILGFISTVSNSPDVSEIIHIYVRSDHWGKKIGSSLLKAALRSDIKTELWVLSANTQAQQFYRSMGFLDTIASRLYSFEGMPVEQKQFVKTASV